jgi:predicted DNA binding protein
MKEVKLSIPTRALLDAGVLPARFFSHNKRLDILRVFAVAEQSAIMIVDIHRKADLYSEDEIARMKEELRERYNLEHFEVIEIDNERKVYSVLLRARIPEVLEDAWKSVGTEAFLDGPVHINPDSISLSFVILGGGEKPLKLLQEFGIEYALKEVRRGPAEGPDDGLTREQRALLKLALELGYYEVPARVNLTQLARYTGVSKAAMSKKLRRAERKILFERLGQKA